MNLSYHQVIIPDTDEIFFFHATAHLQKLMSDKKCAAEKKAEMEDVITQVSDKWVKMLFKGYMENLLSKLFFFFIIIIPDGQLHPARTDRPVCEIQRQVTHHRK